MTFDELGLGPKVLKAVSDTGYETPTPIQAEAIPHVLQGKDVLGIAQTGTGKTASFTLPMIELLSRGRARARMPRSLILEPTRELAAQVAENFELYGKNHKLSMALLIGGVSFAEQEKKLDRGVDVLIATPGRLLDHFERGKVMLSGVQVFVVDEADRMLDMGFIPDIERICKTLPFTRQTLFFSATMPPEIQRITDTFLHNPQRIETAKTSSTAPTVTQCLLNVQKEDKRDVLRGLLTSEDVKNGIIFCNRKRDIGVLERSLKKHGFAAGCLHGDLDQHVRMETLAAFRNGDIKFLVASDVAARGLDIPDVSHVFNFDVPTHAEDYVHRIGRTGRAGRKGTAYMLATKAEIKYLDGIEKLIGNEIPVIGKTVGTDKADATDEADVKTTPAAKAKTRRKTSAKKSASSEKVEKADTSETADATPTETVAPIEAKEDAPAKPRRRRSRKSTEAKEADAKATEAKADDKPAAEADKATDAKADDAGDNASKSATEKAPKTADKPRRSRGRGRDREDKPVLGMGDHVPAFLLQPIRKASSAPANTNEDDELKESA
ncbi:MAG: DEAD/DEAH box helicase [Parvibaculaceae bacterium]|nr:DEAD/DEAH box helicase [Parvibaculaceae bacterium]